MNMKKKVSKKVAKKTIKQTVSKETVSPHYFVSYRGTRMGIDLGTQESLEFGNTIVQVKPGKTFSLSALQLEIAASRRLSSCTVTNIVAGPWEA